jgi:hypothetical protein
VQHISINQGCIKLSLRMTIAHPYYYRTTVLAIMPDLAVPHFEGEMVYSSGWLTETAVQSVAWKMMMKLLSRYWQTKFESSSFRVLPRAVLPDEDPEAVYLEMFAAPVQEIGGDQPLVHTTMSYFYDLDRQMVKLSKESELLHEGFYTSVRLIDQLEHDFRGWNRIYTMAKQEARRNQVNYVGASRMLEAETQQRTTAKEKLFQAETELQKLWAEKAEWECKEKGYLTTISKLEDRVTDTEAECR